jgi:hypothetical protein
MLWACPVSGIWLHGRAVGLTLATVAFGHLMARWPRAHQWTLRVPAPVRGLGYALALTAVLVLAPGVGKAFIYFQF